MNLKNFSPVECTIIGSCLRAVIPQDLESFYKDGILVDRRNGTPMEMDGLSLYQALKAIEKRNGVDFHEERKRIIEAVLKRLEDCDGFFRHPAWTGSEKEIHMRFSSAAIRLLVEGYRDGLLESPAIISKTLKKHLEFSESLGDGLWFLHDSLEMKATGVANPFKQKKNQVWGSTEGNFLVLNTHVDTLVTLLFCLRSVPLDDDKDLFLQCLERGIAALKEVLKPNPSYAWKCFETVDAFMRQWLFGVVSSQSFWAKASRKVIHRIYFPLRHSIRAKVPGFIFSDGYIERDICLDGVGFEYHVVNVWDFAKFLLEARKSGLVEDKDFFEHLGKLVDRGIDYATSSSYSRYLMEGTQRHGGANELCEAMLARSLACGEKQLKAHWKKVFDAIQDVVPPSPAIMGYDPLILMDDFGRIPSSILESGGQS